MNAYERCVIMIKVLVNGSLGKMGTEVVNLVRNNPNLHLLGGLDSHISHNLFYPIYTDVNDILEKPDIIIDFSIPSATIALLPFCLKNSIPIVIATTGFTQEQQNEINCASLQIPIFQSSNLSYEVALMTKIVSELSTKLENPEIEIVETHHSRKIDAPSGTALLLADSINKANGNHYHYVFDRHEKSQKRSPKEIGFSSIRGGNIVGEHSVLFFNDYETIEIKHSAYSRSIFAQGAIKAALFLVGQKAGLYSMEDLL